MTYRLLVTPAQRYLRNVQKKFLRAWIPLPIHIKLFWCIWFSKSQVMAKNLQWYTLHSTLDGMDFHPCSVPWALVFIWGIVWSLYFGKFKKSSTTLCKVIIARTSTRDSNWCQLCPPPLPLAPSKAISIGSKYFWSCTHKLSLRNMLCKFNKIHYSLSSKRLRSLTRAGLYVSIENLSYSVRQSWKAKAKHK